jgi:uncharacterized protein YcbK (DUF882 family)
LRLPLHAEHWRELEPAREWGKSVTLRQKKAIIVVAVLAAASVVASRSMTGAPTGDRTISFYHIHTKETLTVTYKRDGEYVPAAMKQIDWILRDWRKNQAIRMDPQTIDLAWEMYNELGAAEPINIISGYRSPGTNEMLRKTRGGQASKSQHMTGKAIDITFPDVPLKRMRYSALIRERGGVGYYPTSGIPFVHIDTARVRAWPRLPRQELALLFPNARTQHQPASGGPITRADVAAAQSSYRELAVQIAQFHSDRKSPRPTLVAAAKPARKAITVAALGSSATISAPAAKPAAPPVERKPFAVASLGPANLPFAVKPAAPAPDDDGLALGWDVGKPKVAPKPAQAVAALAPAAPRLVAAPKLVDRSSRFTAAPSDRDRTDLAALVQKASLGLPAPKLIAAPQPAARPRAALAAAAAASHPDPIGALAADSADGVQIAALAPEQQPASVTDMTPASLGSGWETAPEFDEDHPDELAYRPFPVAPLLTETPSAHDPALAGIQHHDVAATLDMLDDIGAIPPMRFRPGRQVAQVLWAQQFQGKAVHVDALIELDQPRAPTGVAATIENRPVQTSSR